MSREIVGFFLLFLGWMATRFVEYAMKMAADDRDLVIQDYLDKQSKFSKDLWGQLGAFVHALWVAVGARNMLDLGEDAQAVFQEADADDSGSITFEEFTHHLEDLRVQAFLRSTMVWWCKRWMFHDVSQLPMEKLTIFDSGMELDGVEAVRLFKLLDADGNGSIEIDELLSYWKRTEFPWLVMTCHQTTSKKYQSHITYGQLYSIIGYYQNLRKLWNQLSVRVDLWEISSGDWWCHGRSLSRAWPRFVQGCMCLRGSAKTLDLAMLLCEHRKAQFAFQTALVYHAPRAALQLHAIFCNLVGLQFASWSSLNSLGSSTTIVLTARPNIAWISFLRVFFPSDYSMLLCRQWSGGWASWVA